MARRAGNPGAEGGLKQSWMSAQTSSAWRAKRIPGRRLLGIPAYHIILPSPLPSHLVFSSRSVTLTATTSAYDSPPPLPCIPLLGSPGHRPPYCKRVSQVTLTVAELSIVALTTAPRTLTCSDSDDPNDDGTPPVPQSSGWVIAVIIVVGACAPRVAIHTSADRVRAPQSS